MSVSTQPQEETRVGTYVEDAVAERRHLLLLDQELVDGVIDLGNVELQSPEAAAASAIWSMAQRSMRLARTDLLDCDKIVFDERQVVVVLLAEHADDAGVVDSGRQDDEQVREQKGLLLKIERKGLLQWEWRRRVSYGW